MICALAGSLENIQDVSGLCFRQPDGKIIKNPSRGNPDKLDELPFPKRTTFHQYFGKPIASILSSRGCWRDCAFCSINAWYKQGGGKKFRFRSVENIVEEMDILYHTYGVRIFNFQDDNFFLPDPDAATRRFSALRDQLKDKGVTEIAIAVKARPDSIHENSIRVLDELGLFRVFLGVENASERGLRNLNRICSVEQILNALRILNTYDVHIAYNLLMFEPDTVLDDILVNLRFMETHIENPFNFCRAEAYAGTGLEHKLRAEGLLLGDYFGFDYRLKDPQAEAFHQVANHAFFDRNFSDFGLHYFNMQVDFFYQLMRRFYPGTLTQSMRAAVKNFIKRTNLDTFECLSEIYDFIAASRSFEYAYVREFAHQMRREVNQRGRKLRLEGEELITWLTETYENRGKEKRSFFDEALVNDGLAFLAPRPTPYLGKEHLEEIELAGDGEAGAKPTLDFLGTAPMPVPYTVFKRKLAESEE